MAAKLKKGDHVVVLAGRDKGKEGDILQVIPKEGRAVVSGVNMVIRHTRQTQTSQGGPLTKSFSRIAMFPTIILNRFRSVLRYAVPIFRCSTSNKVCCQVLGHV